MALKNILDKFAFGTYDFVYLRIDFKSGCNVGYAFINFADANGMLSLIDRMEALTPTRLPRFRTRRSRVVRRLSRSSVTLRSCKRLRTAVLA
jgi:hypothetical protein